ncbi:MAG TPA: response regulator [Pyrinomonadaceae bacterium]|nr:response regulator [Pyrinomonadaceae bacterium]
MKRILCLENDRAISRLIFAILEKYDLIQVFSVEEALTKINLEKFDLILLDDQLSDGYGLALCQTIRKTDKITPILLMIGATLTTETEALEMGAQGILNKFSNTFVKDLLAKVENILV